MKARNIIAWIFILIFIDQTIKILINICLGNVHFEIIPSLIEFKPTFNERHSWVNNLLNDNFGLNIGLIPHIILYLLAGILVPMYFSYFKNKISDNKKLIDVAAIFMTAAILCALIGNIIWTKGTLDYIYLKPLFVFDLKDVYIDCGVVMILIYVLKNRKQLESIKVLKIRDVYMDTKNRLREVRTK